MIRARYWLYVIWLSCLRMFRTNLGNQVWYRGRKYTVANGVRCNSWRLAFLDNGDDGWVKRAECRLVFTPSNIAHSFRFGYHFYMSSWYCIWCEGTGNVRPASHT